MLTEWRSGDDFQATGFHYRQAPGGDFEGNIAEIGRSVGDGDGGGIGVEGDGEFFADRSRLDGEGDAIGKDLRGDGEVIGEIGELVFWSDPEAVTAPGDKVIFAGDAEFIGVGFEEIGTTGEMEVGDDSWADIEGNDEFGALVGDAQAVWPASELNGFNCHGCLVGFSRGGRVGAGVGG